MSDRKWGRVFGGPLLIALAMAVPATGCGDDAEPIEPTPHEPDPQLLPPPVSGGTLAVSQDGAVVYASDPDRDAVYVVHVASQKIKEIALQEGDEPGRIVAGDGVIHVALRRGGAVATIDPVTGDIARHAVCAAPRGVDFADGTLHVACAGGELISMRDGNVVRELHLGRDLRDVLAVEDHLVVSQFRSAQITVIDADGNIERELMPNIYDSSGSFGTGRKFSPTVAYRMRKLPDNTIAVVHQRALLDEIPTGPSPGQSYYGGTCDQVIVHAAVTVMDPLEGKVITTMGAGAVGALVLPTDIAISPDGQRVAVPGAGNETVYEGVLSETIHQDFLAVNCVPDNGRALHTVVGEPMSTEYHGGGLLIHTRQPAALIQIDPATGETQWEVKLPGTSRRHAGHALFHKAAGPNSPIACASCHPEGREDGHTWTFSNIGQRRTQDLSGGVLATLPLHWDGDIDQMHDLVEEVFVNRMGGAEQRPEQVDELAGWIDTIPSLPAPAARDEAAAERGKALFSDATVGCATCHVGERLTNNSNLDVGTGKAFQVPSLVGVANRVPLMHDGCAATLADRFNVEVCGGGDTHGKTSQLSEAQIDDLVTYLETL